LIQNLKRNLKTFLAWKFKKRQKHTKTMNGQRRRRIIVFITTDSTNNRHIAEISMEGCRKARAIRASHPQLAYKY